MKLALLISLIALAGCAAKSKPVAAATLVIPPECVTKFEIAGECTIVNGKAKCPAKLQFNCTKVATQK